MRGTLFSYSAIPHGLKMLLLALMPACLVQGAVAGPMITQNSFTTTARPVYTVKKLSLIPDNFRVSQKKSLLGRLYIKLQTARSRENARQVTNAIEELWLTSGSDDTDSLMNSAMIAIEDKDHDRAIGILDTIVKINPAFTEARNKRALVYFLKKDYHSSMTDLQKVLTLDPRHFQAIHGMANILHETGHKKAALKAYRQLLMINPHLQPAIDAVAILKREVEGQAT